MLLNSNHQYQPSQTTEHFDHTNSLHRSHQAMNTPINSSPRSQKCQCSPAFHSESCPSRSPQHKSSPINYSPETSPTSNRRLRGWVRSALTQGTDRPLFDMSEHTSNTNINTDQDVFQKYPQIQRQTHQETTTTAIRPSSAPAPSNPSTTTPTKQKDQSLFGSAGTTGAATGDWNHHRSNAASRDEQFRADRMRATIDSEQAQAMLLKQKIKTTDFQIEVDKRRDEVMSKEEVESRYAAQRRIAESYKRGKGI